MSSYDPAAVERLVEAGGEAVVKLTADSDPRLLAAERVVEAARNLVVWLDGYDDGWPRRNSGSWRLLVAIRAAVAAYDAISVCHIRDSCKGPSVQRRLDDWTRAVNPQPAGAGHHSGDANDMMPVCALCGGRERVFDHLEAGRVCEKPCPACAKPDCGGAS